MSADTSVPLPFGLSGRFSHSIANNFTREAVTSVLDKISKKTAPLQHESSIYAPSVDWINSLSSSISQELSKNFNAPADNFADTSRNVANIISSVGNGTWSTGVTPVNAIRDLETNLPLYISDYFDKLAAWAREHVFDIEKNRIKSNLNDLGGSSNPYPAESPNGPESALSGLYAKISWKLPIVNINRPFHTDSDSPKFGLIGQPSNAEVYRYFAFLDDHKQAMAMNEDGSVTQVLYNFMDSAQLWRVDHFGKFYALYNKKYKKYLGRNLVGTNDKPDNNWHGSAVYIIEDIDTFKYSIGYTSDNSNVEHVLKDLTLVTIPLIAWKNSSGQFLNVNDTKNGTMAFSHGEKHDNIVVPKPEQLFLFVPHPDFNNHAVIVEHSGKFLEFNPLSLNKAACIDYDFKSPSRLPFILFNYDQNIWPWGSNYLASHLQQPLIGAGPPPGRGTRVRVWKSDPSVKKVGIRELFLTNIDIETGPKDSLLEVVSTTGPIKADSNGDFLLDFENTPSQIPETDNHVRFDVVHTFSIVRYAYNMLTGDLQFLDGKPPVLKRPWGENKKLTIYPHAGEMANAFYNRNKASLEFYYMKQDNGPPVYLCRSLDVVAHEAGHSFLDILQPQWLTGSGQPGAFHEAFGDLNSLFVLISMAEIADLFITSTKSNLREPDNFLAVVGEEFGDALYKQKGKGLRNLNNTIKGSQAGTEVHDLSKVFSGFIYDVLVDVFALERNPSFKSDTSTLMSVGTTLRRALLIAIRVSSPQAIPTKFQEVATNLDVSLGALGRRLAVDLTSWRQIVQKHAKARELSIAGLGK